MECLCGEKNKPKHIPLSKWNNPFETDHKPESKSSTIKLHNFGRANQFLKHKKVLTAKNEKA